ncbi:MAG: T9SS type A sorting domain-containing protein, partial [Hymenobacteraceae bacterium]|nr:T9SS type A sorting domain-containing protein [Hymenobacteraceae bacterium]
VLADGWLGAMQGFFVQVTTPGTTSFFFTNAARPAGLQAAPAYRTVAPPQVQLRVSAATDPAQADYATVYCAPGATTALEPAVDAWKQPSVGTAPTLFTRPADATDALALNAIAPLTDADVLVPVGLNVPVAGTYHLAATATRLPTGWRVLLEDALTGTAHELTAATPYALTLPAGAVAPTRLRLRLTARPGDVTGLHPAAGAEALALTLSPNPTHDAVRLSVSDAAVTNTTIAIMDLRGAVVRTQTLNAGRTDATLSVNGLPAGIYVVRVGRLTRRLVVQ